MQVTGYVPASKCATSFCTPSKKICKSALSAATEAGCFSEAARIFAFSLKLCGLKPAVGAGAALTSQQREVCSAVAICFSAQQQRK